MICLNICETLLQSARSRPLIGAERRNFTKFYRQLVFPDDLATFWHRYGPANQKQPGPQKKKQLYFNSRNRVSNFVERLMTSLHVMYKDKLILPSQSENRTVHWRWPWLHPNVRFQN